MQWAPRVARHAIRRLYRADARGLVDAELIDDVGFALYVRCQSIIRATAAHRGTITCPLCEAAVPRARSRTVQGQVLRCAGCGWTTTWGRYYATYKRGYLNGGSALGAIKEFERRFPTARTPTERLLAIDRLIHSFHHELQGSTRPAGINLIEGSLDEVLEFLTALSRDGGPPARSAAEDARIRDALGRAGLGNRLRVLRHAAGLTGRQAGALVGGRASTISMIETGRTLPTPELTGRLARALGAGADDVDALMAEAARLRS